MTIVVILFTGCAEELILLFFVIWHEDMKKGSSMKDKVIGIGFYRREQWPLFLETAIDPQVLGKTYDEWLDVLDSSIDKIRAYGIEPELIDVDVNDLLAFCEKHGMKNNAEARSRFITEVAREKGIKKLTG